MKSWLLALTIFVLLSYNSSAQIVGGQGSDNTTTQKKDIDEYILKHGFFIDGLVQYASVTQSSYYYNYNLAGIALGFRLGNKWYFGKMKPYRPGIAVTWMRMNGVIGVSSGSAKIIIVAAPVNIGFTNALSFKGKIGLEVNINFGFNFLYEIGGYWYPGMSINPNIKFRYKTLAVGIDINHMFGSNLAYSGSYDDPYEFNSTFIGITIGRKF